MSSNMERVAAMPDASLYVNRDGRRADDCVDSHGGGNLTRSQDPVARDKSLESVSHLENWRSPIHYVPKDFYYN